MVVNTYEPCSRKMASSSSSRKRRLAPFSANFARRQSTKSWSLDCSFSKEIYATLQAVQPGARISCEAVRTLDCLIVGAFDLLAETAGAWSRLAGRRTLTDADLAWAVDRLLPGGYAHRAGRRALARSFGAVSAATASATAPDAAPAATDSATASADDT
ncbi:hypothetical protein BOX15_Mlig020207g1 [Macrostomum lignano]|uniref:Histone H2A/H2B/H3 domain-containing protein n=1 Tax=Macrostomum lignano TaxID=282301 RepID=A0A267EWH6_9PLAT|nr:hypothetical protein BOX15_Mlig020207g1 [Macrostomum lignano]